MLRQDRRDRRYQPGPPTSARTASYRSPAATTARTGTCATTAAAESAVLLPPGRQYSFAQHRPCTQQRSRWA